MTAIWKIWSELPGH